MINKIINNTRTLEKALDASWLRNEAISQNIANVDTPGYKKKTVAFEQFLSDAISDSSFKGNRTDPRHIPIGANSVNDIDINITEDNSALSMRLDGNNVDIESEMASMAKNTIQFNAIEQRLSSKFKSIKNVIKEGRG